MTYRKHHGSFNFWEGLAYKLAFRPDEKFEIASKTLPPTFGLINLNIFAVEPNFIITNIGFRLDVFIVCLLLKFLSMIEIFLANNY